MNSFLCLPSLLQNKYLSVCVHAKLLQSCLTICDFTDCSLPGSSVHELSRQEYWSGFPCHSPGDLPNPGIKPRSFMSPAFASEFLTTSATQETQTSVYGILTVIGTV